MRQFILLMSLFLAAFSQLKGQETEGSSSVINEFYFHIGVSNERGIQGTLQDFHDLAPNSQILNRSDLNDYSPETNYSSTSENSSLFSVMLAMPVNKNKFSPIFRVGLTYFTSTNYGHRLKKETETPLDTLISTQTGNEYPVSSIQNEAIYMDFITEQIRLESSLIFRTNPEARWSLYAGFGISVGAIVNSRTKIRYNTREWQEMIKEDGNKQRITNWTSDWTEENHGHDNIMMGATAFVPMGLNLRLGKEKEFWNLTSLFYEFRPGVNMTFADFDTYSTRLFQHNFGIRVAW